MKKRFNVKTGKWTLNGEPCDEPPSMPQSHSKARLATFNRGWPIHSDAAGCHPSQIEEHRKFDRLHGCVTDYDNTGRPILTDRVHRKKYLKIHGLHDNDGGYSD